MNTGTIADAGCRLEVVMNAGTVRITIVTVAWLLLVLGSTPGQAQQEPLHGLQPVDQRVADNGPLSTSLRWVQYGLREPYSFSELYQLPIGQKDFVRRNAGLWAVFPRSLYIGTDDGVYSSVPAGTVYYIGGPKDVITRIAEIQAPFVLPGHVDLTRIEESRIQATLLDYRVPPSSIQPTMSTGRDQFTPPTRTESEHPPSVHGSVARSEWIASMPTLDFVHDEAYRRRCVSAAMALTLPSNREDTRREEVQAPAENKTDVVNQP